MKKNVLVIAAHPDDEILGCGGTLIKHIECGDSVFALIVCEGESLRYVNMNVHQHDDTQRAAKEIGLSKVLRLDFPDQRLDTFCLVDVITPIEKVISEIKPETIYVQFGGDLNKDHQIVFEATMVAARPTNNFVREIYAFYTIGSTELGLEGQFEPDTWVDISNQLEKKIRAFSCYESEVRELPHPRSFEGLRNAAYFFGNQCNMAAAESFMTIRRKA